MLLSSAGCSADRFGDTHPHLNPLPEGEEIPLPFKGRDRVGMGLSDEKELNALPVSSYIPDIPFFPGEDFQCGPAVLAGVLNHLGYDVKPEDISREIYLENVKGTLNMDMVSFVKRFEGITVTELQGDLTLLRENLSMSYPLIVFVDLGIWNIRKGHYMLVVGYDDRKEGVIVYSGAEKDKVIGYKDFMRMWERGGYWSLRITKREISSPPLERGQGGFESRRVGNAHPTHV